MSDPLTEFIESHAPQLQTAVNDDTELLEQGLLDSLLLMHLMAFLERRHGIEIPDEEVVPENFATLRRIRALVARIEAQRAP